MFEHSYLEEAGSGGAEIMPLMSFWSTFSVVPHSFSHLCFFEGGVSFSNAGRHIFRIQLHILSRV